MSQTSNIEVFAKNYGMRAFWTYVTNIHHNYGLEVVPFGEGMTGRIIRKRVVQIALIGQIARSVQ